MTGLCILIIIRNLFQWENYFWTAKIFFLNCFFKWAKLAKFIRFEALWELLFKQTFFYRKVHGDVVKWLHFWELWGTSEMFWEGHGYSVGRCRKTFSLMKRFFTALCLVQNDRGSIFCSRLEICFSERIIFETQRFLLLNYFF